MAEEKEKTQFEETASDHATTDENGDVIDEKRLLRKLDWHLVPGPTILLLLSFMDRSNGNPFRLLPRRLPLIPHYAVGNARIEGLIADLHMSEPHPSHT